MKCRLIAVLILLSISVPGPVAEASQAPPEPPGRVAQEPKLSTKVKDRKIAQSNLKKYQTLLRKYCAGDPSASETLLSWDAESLTDAVTLINSIDDDTRPWSVADIKAAALMHTDAVFSLLPTSGHDDTVVLQLDVAGRVLVRGAPFIENPGEDLARRNAEVRAFASRWYVALSRVLRDRIRFDAAHILLRLGRDRLPGDAAVLYESGTMEEFIATQPWEKLPADLASRFAGHQADVILNRLHTQHEQQLADAERWLRQSLALMPGQVAAQLRLGRVLMLRGKDEEAARAFAAIPDPSADVRYLTAMFLGALEERRGAIAPAIEAYKRAAAVLPRAQSANIALSQLLQRQGHGEESRLLVEALVSETSIEPDPWWIYFFEQPATLISRLDALFKEIGR